MGTSILYQANLGGKFAFPSLSRWIFSLFPTNFHALGSSLFASFFFFGLISSFCASTPPVPWGRRKHQSLVPVSCCPGGTWLSPEGVKSVGGDTLSSVSQGHSLSWDLAPTTQSHGRTLSPVKEAREKMNMSPPSSASKNATVPPA